MITLIIVDCQNDFITGTVTVKGAKNILEEIKKFVKNHRKEIDKIIFTVDWHPYNHISFKKYGGQLPHHCIQYTPGACIEPKLLKYIQSLNLDYEVLQKGIIKEIDESAAFNDIEFDTDELGQRYFFDSLVIADFNTTFVICGIEVQSAISNLIFGGINPKIYFSGTVSSDMNNLEDFIKKNKLEKVV